MTDEQLLELAAGFGFDHVGMLNAPDLEFNSAVRDMCAADKCHSSYGKCWTCPDAPCRFPELAVPSMEASGLNVSKTCEDSGIGYYYGPRTITFTCCILTD